MRPISFLAFRDELNPASGFQSMQFREIEFSSGLKDDAVLRSFAQDDFARKRLETRMTTPSLSEAFFALLRRRGHSTFRGDDDPATKRNAATAMYGKRPAGVKEMLTHPEQLSQEYQLAEALLEHDEYFSLWRSHHIKMVERMVGTKRGTGGSEGVGYLQKTLDKKFFPEIWEARTFLSTKHDDQGCPFAK